MKKTQAMAAQQGVMHIAGHICEGQTLDARGHDVRVTIIKGGKSVNGYYYDEQALQYIAHMIDGARAYADHGRSEADQQTRSVRDMVGFYKDAQHFPPGAGSPHGRVDATLHVLEAAAWLWSIIQEAVALDRPDLIGLSIDIFGNWQPSEERQAKQVTRVLSLNSCDIVTRPSAGGSFQRILHHHDTQGEPFSRIYPNMDKPYSVSSSCFNEESFTTPSGIASAPLSTGVFLPAELAVGCFAVHHANAARLRAALRSRSMTRPHSRCSQI